MIDFLNESGADSPGLLHICFTVSICHYAALTKCYSRHAVAFHLIHFWFMCS